MKDRLNKKNWTINLSGSIFPSAAGGDEHRPATGSTLSLTSPSSAMGTHANSGRLIASETYHFRNLC